MACGAALRESPEYSPREIISSVKTLKIPLAAISRGEFPYSREGRSVVRPGGSRQVVRGKVTGGVIFAPATNANLKLVLSEVEVSKI